MTLKKIQMLFGNLFCSYKNKKVKEIGKIDLKSQIFEEKFEENMNLLLILLMIELLSFIVQSSLFSYVLSIINLFHTLLMKS